MKLMAHVCAGVRPVGRQLKLEAANVQDSAGLQVLHRILGDRRTCKVSLGSVCSFPAEDTLFVPSSPNEAAQQDQRSP